MRCNYWLSRCCLQAQARSAGPLSGLAFDIVSLDRAKFLLEPHARLIAIGELDTGLFQGALDRFDGAWL